jgi:hypothetical protein
MQSFLRFSPPEYRMIARLCRPLNPTDFPPHKLRRFLVEALYSRHLALAERLAHLQPGQLLILHRHFWGVPRPDGQNSLTPPEVKAFIDVFGPLLRHSRFTRPLKWALVRHLLEGDPELARKIRGLTPEQFEKLCRQVKGRLAGEA